MGLAEAIFFNLLTVFGQTMLTDVVPMTNYVPEPEYAQELYCLAINTYHETRGEDFDSKLAVAQSVMNRVNDDSGEFRRYDTPCSVVHRSRVDENNEPILNKCWYSWYCDGLPDNVRIYKDGVVDVLEEDAWRESVLTAFYAYHGLYEPIIGDSTHYYNFNLVNPDWVSHYEFVADIGQHRFLR